MKKGFGNMALGALAMATVAGLAARYVWWGRFNTRVQDSLFIAVVTGAAFVAARLMKVI